MKLVFCQCFFTVVVNSIHKESSYQRSHGQSEKTVLCNKDKCAPHLIFCIGVLSCLQSLRIHVDTVCVTEFNSQLTNFSLITCINSLSSLLAKYNSQPGTSELRRWEFRWLLDYESPVTLVIAVTRPLRKIS